MNYKNYHTTIKLKIPIIYLFNKFNLNLPDQLINIVLSFLDTKNVENPFDKYDIYDMNSYSFVKQPLGNYTIDFYSTSFFNQFIHNQFRKSIREKDKYIIEKILETLHKKNIDILIASKKINYNIKSPSDFLKKILFISKNDFIKSKPGFYTYTNYISISI